jgi:hypothetical protein
MANEFWAQSKNVDWYTPKYIFDALNIDFDLDPCSPPLERYKTRAKHHYILPESDGLQKDWFGKVWCNPPYGRGEIVKWVKKIYEHNNGILITHVTALPNKWFHTYFDRITAICFIKGRVNFINGLGQSAGASPQGQMLICFGQELKQNVIHCNLGKVWVTK